MFLTLLVRKSTGEQRIFSTSFYTTSPPSPLVLIVWLAQGHEGTIHANGRGILARLLDHISELV